MALRHGIYARLSGKSPELVHPVIKNQRMAICKACPNLVFKTNCKLCACFVDWKTDYKTQSCPIKKWEEISVN